jgi:hypothetical protein
MLAQPERTISSKQTFIEPKLKLINEKFMSRKCLFDFIYFESSAKEVQQNIQLYCETCKLNNSCK